MNNTRMTTKGETPDSVKNHIKGTSIFCIAGDESDQLNHLDNAHPKGNLGRVHKTAGPSP